MTETRRTEYSFIYLVKLSLTAWFLMAALKFVTSHLRCSSVAYIIILSHNSVHNTGVRIPISTFALSSRNGATMSLLLDFRIISSDCDTVMRVDFDIEDM